MKLDPSMMSLIFSKQKQAVIESRGTGTDFAEAKANITVNRILDEGRRIAAGVMEVDEITEQEKSQSFNADTSEEGKVTSFILPPRESAGLEDFSISLDESQVAAIDLLSDVQYGCLIGPAGSGKTTVTKYLLSKLIYGDSEKGTVPMNIKQLSGRQGLNIALVAFTGIATQVIKQNMPEWLWSSCKTIHSLLEFAPTSTEITSRDGGVKETKIFMPSRDRLNKLDHDIIMVDEASMVGVELWHQLLDACKPGTRIFLIGDLNQLPPVTSHSMFAYALATYKVAELTKIHRQKEEAANRIVDTAHSVLNGKEFPFDDPATNPNWRVIGFKLDAKPEVAGAQIVGIANKIRTQKVNVSVDPDQALIYDPLRDRIITTGNGYDENKSNSSVQQFPINEALSRLIVPTSDENPRYIIEAAMGQVKKFAVGYRVMATKNEAPDMEERVTNGMTGVIEMIEPNPDWTGNHALFGPENLVSIAKRQQIDRIFNGETGADYSALDSLENLASTDFEFSSGDDKKEREGGGPSSHRVTVRFANGAVRRFSNKAGVDSLQLAYATTCHKCQGSQFDTAIIVVHHVTKGMLSREWLYTAITRAQKRVILLYTDLGVRSAIAKQRIFGRTLEEKIRRYQEMENESLGLLKVRVRLFVEN